MARVAYHACRTFVSESIYITFISHFYRFYEWNTEILYMGLMCSVLLHKKVQVFLLKSESRIRIVKYYDEVVSCKLSKLSSPGYYANVDY